MNRLRELRKKQNMTLEELSPIVNLSFAQLAKLERGDSLMNSSQIAAFSRLFKVSADYLLGLSDNLVPKKINYYKEVLDQQKLTLDQVLSRFKNNEVMIVYTEDLITIIEEPHKLERKIFKFEKIK